MANEDVAMPEFRYFMVTWGVSGEFGGMTTMCLTRSRSLVQLAGVNAPVLTFEFQPDYSEIFSSLQRQGHVVDGMEVLNIYHFYRSANLLEREALDTPSLVEGDIPPEGVQNQTIRDADGDVFCQIARSLDAETEYRRKFLRPDGTVFLHEENLLQADGSVQGCRLSLLDPRGRVIGQYQSRQDLFEAWLQELSGGQPTVFVSDSVQTTTLVGNLQGEHILKFAVLHNSHIVDGGDPLRGKLAPGRKDVVTDSSVWDGLLFLTERQKSDFIERFGAADNLYWLSNPSARSHVLPAFSKRVPDKGVLLGNLEPRKNVHAAIEVIDAVRKQVPSIQLDVYGDGKQRRPLQQRIDELELGDNITLHGRVADAASNFTTAQFSLLTSRKEGQPLVLLESLGQGCPPVAFNIRYGPEDVIDDGVNGYLVEEGDIEAAAQAVAEICSRSGRAEEMSNNAWESSRAFGHVGVLERFGSIVDQAWEQKRSRVNIRDAEFILVDWAMQASGHFEVSGEFSWTSENTDAHELLTPHIQLVPRTKGNPLKVPADSIQRGTSHLNAHFVVYMADFGTATELDDLLDVYVLLSGRNFLFRRRVDFRPSQQPWIPYSTANGKLSFRVDASAR